jgi:hypothetical protein
MGTIAQRIFDMAQELARETPGLHERIGPGEEAGNGVTTRFLESLNRTVTAECGDQVRLQERTVPNAKYSFDYFIPSEETAVEIALGIRNPVSEFEKDIFKAILAKDMGKPLRKLVLIGTEGAIKCRDAPGPTAISRWVKQKCGIEVEVKELTSNGRIRL